MKPTTELFDLVKSMTKSEKRFFKLSSTLQSGEKNYIRIFDVIDEQDEYDEQKVKDKFKGETFIQHFPSEKNHLYKLILKSLRNFHSENSINSILRQEIKNIEILYKKALYRECAKFVSRAKKMALEHEKFYYLFDLINWEKQLLEEEYETGDFDKDLDQLISEETQCIEKLRNLAEYHMIYSRANFVIRKGGFARTENERKIVREISNYHLIKGKNTALSARAASICYYIKGVCAAFDRDYEEALVNFEKVKDIINRNEKLRPDLASRYVRMLNLTLNCYIESKRFNEANAIIQELNRIKDDEGFDSTNIQLRIFTTTVTAQLQICNKTGDYQRGISLVPEIIKMLDKLSSKINKEQVVEFYYNLSGIYFIAGEYKEALYWLNKVLNDNEKNLRRDIYNFSRIFNLVIHYELGNYDLLEYVIKSTTRYLNKDEKEYNAEMILIKHLRKLIKTTNDKLKQEGYKNMKQDLEEIFENKGEDLLLNYFDILTWVESKIQRVAFPELLKRGLEVSSF